VGLLADHKPAVREKRSRRPRAPDLVEMTLKLLPSLDSLDVRMRLPLVDLSLPALRAMSPRQYEQFLTVLTLWPRTIGWGYLSGRFTASCCGTSDRSSKTAAQAAYYGLQKLGEQMSVLLSTLAADNRGGDAAAAFNAGRKLSGVAVRLLPADEWDWSR
jgi:hypothetical protein